MISTRLLSRSAAAAGAIYLVGCSPFRLPAWNCDDSELIGLCGATTCPGSARLATDTELPFDWLLRVDNPKRASDKSRLKLVSSVPQRVRIADVMADDILPIYAADSCSGGREISLHARLTARAVGSTTLQAFDGEQWIGSFAVEVHEVASVLVLSAAPDSATATTPIENVTLRADDPDLFWMRAVALSASGEELAMNDELIVWTVEPTGIVELQAQGPVASLFTKRVGDAVVRVRAGRAGLEVPVTVTPYPEPERDDASADTELVDSGAREAAAMPADGR